MTLRAAKIRVAKFASSYLFGFSVHREAIGARVPVLCYHRVLPWLKEGARPIYTLTPEEFANQMAFLADSGFRSLSLDEYASFAGSWAEPPSRSVLVTFDDGYADNYHIAWPLAARYGMRLNLFLCTGLIEGNIASTYGELTTEAKFHRQQYPDLWRPLTWSEIGRMTDGGVGIGFHSHTHRNYGQMTAAEIAEDLATGLSLLESKVNVHPRAFAFPGGSSGTYNPQVVSFLRSRGLQLLFTTHLGRTYLGRGEFLFSRLVIYQDDDLEVFRRKLFGAYDWLGKARSFDQSLRALLLQ
jgi:peptidoglycan/xylan/chitin deacetylase (PgdA/CDA1 family)